jgi:hypothetical protein
LAREGVDDLAALAFAVCGQADKHMRFGCVIDAVIELRHAARAARQIANQLAKSLEAAALFGDGHGKQGFAFFADASTLGYKTQPVKVHVGAAQNRGVSLALGLVQGDVLLDGGDRQRTRRLDDAARVDKDVFDGGADRVGVDRHEFVHQLAADAEGFFTDPLDRRTV